MKLREKHGAIGAQTLVIIRQLTWLLIARRVVYHFSSLCVPNSAIDQNKRHKQSRWKHAKRNRKCRNRKCSEKLVFAHCNRCQCQSNPASNRMHMRELWRSHATQTNASLIENKHDLTLSLIFICDKGRPLITNSYSLWHRSSSCVFCHAIRSRVVYRKCVGKCVVSFWQK